MLATANRIRTAGDYRRLVRTGRRYTGEFTTVSARRSTEAAPLRLGVIVAKSVGGAVVRNRVRRRIKAVGWAVAHETSGLDVVVRALPASAGASWAELDHEVRAAIGTLAALQPSRSAASAGSGERRS